MPKVNFHGLEIEISQSHVEILAAAFAIWILLLGSIMVFDMGLELQTYAGAAVFALALAIIGNHVRKYFK